MAIGKTATKKMRDAQSKVAKGATKRNDMKKKSKK